VLGPARTPLSYRADPLPVGTVVLRRWGLGPLSLRIPCRVLEVVDEPERQGLGYGTLPGHPETGQESSLLERLADATGRHRQDNSGNGTVVSPGMTEWSFLTPHARALLCIAHDPGVRLRDIASDLLVTERTAFGIVRDLVNAGYVLKERDGRRNRYEVQGHLPLPDPLSRASTVGEVLALLVGDRVEPLT